MIKVGLDISQLAHKGGVNTYTDCLSKELVKQKDLEMIFFYSSLRKPYKGVLPNVKNFKLPPTLFELVFNRIRLMPIENLIGSIDVFHSSDWIQPPTKAKKVTTYHDLIPLKFPEWSHPKIVEVHKKRLELVEKEIDMVIAVSKTTKKDLLEISKIPESKIKVIYEGVDKKFTKATPEQIKEFKKKYNLPEKFVLGIGGVGERRNLKRAREAANNYIFLVTGEDLPFIPNEEMPILYSAARCLLYPSLYEGFGLPILEAMACHTPVITSNLEAMAEIAGKNGDGALLIDPQDIKQIAESLKLIMEDDQIWDDIGSKGVIHAGKFRWDNTAAETIAVYQELCK